MIRPQEDSKAQAASTTHVLAKSRPLAFSEGRRQQQQQQQQKGRASSAPFVRNVGGSLAVPMSIVNLNNDHKTRQVKISAFSFWLTSVV